MKKNKTIAYMLAATLLVGGTFAGTKAWFTDQGKADTDLVITTGTLDVEVEDMGWYLIGKTEGKPIDKEGISGNTVFENLKPGDILNKTIFVQNNGSLDQVLDIEGGIVNEKKGPFDIEISKLNELDGKTLKVGEGTSFEIKVTIDKEWEGQDMKFDIRDYMTDIVINAEKTPAGFDK